MAFMNIRVKIYKFVLGLVVLVLLGWIGVTIYDGNYLEAVAISGVSSILLWFALGAGNTRDTEGAKNTRDIDPSD